MLHREFRPPEELRDAIKCFWHNRRELGELASTFEILPDGYAEIIFYFGAACTIRHAGGEQRMPSPFMVGLLKQPILLTATNRFEIIGIRCFPWAVFDLLGLPSGNDGVRIFEHPIARLAPVLESLVRGERIEEARTIVAQYFLNARARTAVQTMLSKAGAAMSEARGTMPVREVAEAAHTTMRSLERKFKKSSGHSVKDVSVLMRFEQVRNRLWLDPGTKLAGLAQELGYADQSHLTREFKRYSGITPAKFARKAKRTSA